MNTKFRCVSLSEQRRGVVDVVVVISLICTNKPVVSSVVQCLHTAQCRHHMKCKNLKFKQRNGMWCAMRCDSKAMGTKKQSIQMGHFQPRLNSNFHVSREHFNFLFSFFLSFLFLLTLRQSANMHCGLRCRKLSIHFVTIFWIDDHFMIRNANDTVFVYVRLSSPMKTMAAATRTRKNVLRINMLQVIWR